MKYLLSQLLNPTFKCSGSLQPSFDLLGELIKFNPEVNNNYHRYPIIPLVLTTPSSPFFFVGILNA
jgi:hypothetical protein